MGSSQLMHYHDFWLLFLTNILRMTSYGILALVLYQHLFYKGILELNIGILQACIFLGDISLSFFLKTLVDLLGKRFTLIASSMLKIIAAFAYINSGTPSLLVATGILGAISVTGSDCGPFSTVEQSALNELILKCTDRQGQIERTALTIIKLYKVASLISNALGSALAGYYIQHSLQHCQFQFQAISDLFKIYMVITGVMIILYFCLSEQVEKVNPVEEAISFSIDLNSIKNINLLCLLDGFSNAFLVNTCLSYYFEDRYKMKFEQLGVLLFSIVIAKAIASNADNRLAQSFGKYVIIFSFLASNILLLLIPFTENVSYSLGFILISFLLSGIEKPAKQAYKSKMKQSVSILDSFLKISAFAGGLILNGVFFEFSKKEDIVFSLGFILAGALKILLFVLPDLVIIDLWTLLTRRRRYRLDESSDNFEDTSMLEKPRDEDN